LQIQNVYLVFGYWLGTKLNKNFELVMGNIDLNRLVRPNRFESIQLANRTQVVSVTYWLHTN